MNTKLTWWILAVSFVASIIAVINVIANVCRVDAASIVTSKVVSSTCYRCVPNKSTH